MHLTADLPHGMGTLRLALQADGPTVYANGTVAGDRQQGTVLTGINEAASSVTGTYLGRPVVGLAYVAQFGMWKSRSESTISGLGSPRPHEKGRLP